MKPAPATDGSVDLDVFTGALDKIVMVEGAVDTNLLTAAIDAVEGVGDSIVIASAWTGTAFEFDASALLDTDANGTTGEMTISVQQGDTATLTLKGTGNNDVITAGRGADTIEGNAGNDTIVGDEVVNQAELEVVTFAATYDAGDVITVTHNGNAMTATITVDGVTGTAVANAFAAFDLAGADGIVGDSINMAGDKFCCCNIKYYGC